MTDNSLDTVGEYSGDLVSLRELVEGLYYCHANPANCGKRFLVGLLFLVMLSRSSTWVLALASRVVGVHHLNALAARTLALLRA